MTQITEKMGFKFLWSAITTFNILYLLNLWLLDRTNELLINIFHFDDTRESAPVFGLTFGTLVTLCSFILLKEYIKHTDGKSWHARVPPLWVDIDVASSLGRKWRAILMLLTVAFPMLVHIHFWNRLSEFDVWRKNDNIIWGLWEFVSPRYLFDFDAHRYGQFSERALETFGGVSFVPFWEPALMGLLSGLLLLNGVALIRALLEADIQDNEV